MIIGMIDLLVCYGICFGLMNKATIIHDKVGLLDKMLSCSYCTGFNCGWVWFFCVSYSNGVYVPGCDVGAIAIGALGSAFCSGAFCYIIDSLSQLAEGWTPRGE